MSLAAQLIEYAFDAVYFLLLIRVLLSWIPHHENQPIVSVIYKVSDPILRPFQDIVPSWRIGIDLSPLFAFIALGIVKKILFIIFF